MSPALPIASGQQAIAALQQIGFAQVSQKGSHAKLRHKDGRIVIVPVHYELAKGTLKSILRQAAIDTDEFLRLLSK